MTKQPTFPKYVPHKDYNSCGHKLISYFYGYIQFFEEVERRMKKGIKQTKCPKCGLYCFPDEMKSTNKKFINKLPI
jgi:hypothetical protein